MAQAGQAVKIISQLLCRPETIRVSGKALSVFCTRIGQLTMNVIRNGVDLPEIKQVSVRKQGNRIWRSD